MRIPRFFHDSTLAAGTIIILGEDVTRHIVRVLRLKPGAPIILFNGKGGEYHATLTSIDNRRAVADITEYIPRNTESELHLHLVQCISRGERMDYTVQKAVELGVSEITPVLSEHSVVHLDGVRGRKKRQHWQSIAVNACEQSGRTGIPEVHVPRSLIDWFSETQAGTGLFLDPQANLVISALDARPEGAVYLLSGPEGGFSDDERSLALEAGYTPTRLGPRVLRTETAAVAALTVLQLMWGDLGY